jgi:hypothetical protein
MLILILWRREFEVSCHGMKCMKADQIGDDRPDQVLGVSQ